MSDHAAIERARGLAALAGVIAIWSSVAVILKYFTGYLDAWTVMGVRFTLAAVALLPLVLRYRRREPAAFAHLCRQARVPALVHFAGQVLWSTAPYFNQASVVMFVGRSAFCFSMFFGFLLLPTERRLKGRPLFWCGVVLTLFGLAAMFAGSSVERGTTPVGLFIMVCTALFWGLYGISIRRWLTTFPATVSFGVVSLYTAPGFLLFLLSFGEWSRLYVAPWPVLSLLVAAALISIALGHVLSYTAIRHFGPILCEGAFNTIPFFTALLALWVFDDRLTPLQWTGGCVILVGSVCFLVMMARRERPPAAPPAPMPDTPS